MKKVLITILSLIATYIVVGQSYSVNTQVKHGDTLFLKTITYTYHFDSTLKYAASQYWQDSAIIYDTAWYYQKYRVIDNSTSDSIRVTHVSAQEILGYTPVPETRTVNGKQLTGNVSIVKGDVGLGNVDNTSDAAKPISTATQTALDTKQTTLVSGTNIKTVNNQSILGSGNIAIAGGEAFPVGSVFISVVPTDPNTLLGYGTWVAFGAGRVLVGQDGSDTDFDVAEETGGSKTKTITAGNLPQLSVTVTDPGHAHIQNKNTATTGPLSGTTPDASTNSSAQSGYSTEPATTGITATANTGGANTALDVMNPYIVVYMWKRTN